VFSRKNKQLYEFGLKEKGEIIDGVWVGTRNNNKLTKAKIAQDERLSSPTKSRLDSESLSPSRNKSTDK
jgi:hypothetical protein